MDKSLAQSTISKSKPVSSSSDSEDDCDKKCKKNPELEELIELQEEHYELLNTDNDFIRFWRSIQKPNISSTYVC